MPKEELHLQPLREVRGKKRKAFGNTHPSEVYFQVIGNGTAGGATSLFLYTDHQRYLVKYLFLMSFEPTTLRS